MIESGEPRAESAADEDSSDHGALLGSRLSALGFVHLHVHSWFSFGEGTSSPEALVRAAAARGFDTLALTDTNGVYGAVEFQRVCDEAGIRPILGARLVAGGHETVALAEDARGWGALCRAITAIKWNPDVDLPALLARDREGLVLLSADPALLERVVRESGPADLYGELRPGPLRHRVAAAAGALGLPVVATGGVIAANAEDWPRHRLLAAIHRNTSLSAVDALWPVDAWLRPVDDLARHFPDRPDAIAAAARIADRCRWRIPTGRIIPPRAIDTTDALARLTQLAEDGVTRRYGPTPSHMVRPRLAYELGIIAEKRFADYFLIVHDIVHADGVTHCGRGSVANSLVSYCLGITHVDPVDSGLLFERFLNPSRTDPPDIDLDFPWDERDAIFARLFRRYPMPQAAMVANHNTLRLAGALREVAKVHGRPAAEIREVTRRVPMFAEGTPASVLTTHPNFRDLRLPALWTKIAAMAGGIVGTPHHLSLHPGGVVIVPGALTDVVPIEPAKKTLDGAPDLTVPVIQFEKDGTEDAGLVKIDLLGNRSLAVIRDAIRQVDENTGARIDYSTQDAGNDPATRRLFATGDTLGVFYTESPASRLLNLKSKAEDFDRLVLNTSIIRPAGNPWINTYLERLYGTPYEPVHPAVRDTLAPNFGVMAYQEDVVNVAHDFAGFTWARADGLRKVLSKKRVGELLPAYEAEFRAGALALGRDEASIATLWSMILSFSGYSFCKGHSCSYIHVAQQSCYLRAHHPAEFIAAVLANGGGFYRAFAYVAEARRMGVTILPPDVNASRERCTGHGDALRVGFQFVKGLSAAGLDRLLAARAADGPFRTLAELRARAALHDDDLRLLVKVGACDTLEEGWNRPQRLWMIDAAPAERPDALLRERVAVPPLRDYSAERKRRDAWALLGFCLDAHPMTLHARDLARFRLTSSRALGEHVGKTVLMAGMYTTGKPVHTAKDEPMQFATFDDGDGLVECVIFPDVYRDRVHVLFDQGPFIFRGVVEEAFGALTVTITQIDRLERMLARIAAQRAA